MAHAARAGRDGKPPAVRRLREMAALWRKAGGSRSAPSLRTASPVTVLLVLVAYDVIQYVTLVFQTPRQLDFYVFWLAPRIGLAQGWVQMYNPARFLPELVAQTGNWLPYLNPPVFAWLLLPLSLLPYPVALVIWNAFILGCLVVIWRVTVWRAAPTLTLPDNLNRARYGARFGPVGTARALIGPRLRRGREILLLLAALALYPVVLGLALGQVTMVVVPAVAVGLAAVAVTLYVSWKAPFKDVELPIAAGLIGSLLVTPYVTVHDLSALVLAAWLVLRLDPARWITALLVVGYVPLFLANANFAHLPVLLLEGAFLASLVTLARARAKTVRPQQNVAGRSQPRLAS